ncbi:uncharacterized protein LODBEIA_P02250 [Lodderomyces beijingensis]|uniref:NAD-dependent epimerase/dehydratase domain-containing protein n=1 Tax=Lodderomyces beijingensis TaxID=1775926 RepID=A0ABP0ZGN4_9ASCO
MAKVFITGASGFIAQHIVKLLLEQGHQVIGTVRSQAKGEQLASYIPKQFKSSFTFEIVPDIAAPHAFDAALQRHQDIEFLLHTASPFTYDTVNPERDLIIPAIQGTKNILEGANKYCPQLQRVVITSSDAAIYSNVDERNNKLFFNEQSWNNIKYADAVKDAVAAYYGAKSFAEKLAWEFLLMETPRFDLVAVNPSYVFGPQSWFCDPAHLNVSNALIGDLLDKKQGAGESSSEVSFENEIGGFVDVRDVARAHLFAMTDANASGKRLFMTNGHFSVQMMLDLINQHFPQLHLIKGTPGSGEKDISVLAQVENKATKQLLPWEFNSLETIVVDTVQQILDSKSKL